MQRSCIIIAGPTASGKTAIAIELARHFSTQIISADSRQCYRELNIGVAKPSAAELAQVPHHFINSHSIQDDVTAATFERYALEKAQEIFASSDTVIMAGGTGLYIRAFEQGLDAIPAVPPALRRQLSEDFAANGMAWLLKTLAEHDPIFSAEGEMQNPQRMLRALEVKLATGHSISSYQKHDKQQRPFRMLKFILEIPRPHLYASINERTDVMMQAGLEAEARSLLPFRHLNALQTVGYKELFDYFDGNCSLPQAVDKIKQHTRQYARRQVTWFGRDEGTIRVSPAEAVSVILGQR